MTLTERLTALTEPEEVVEFVFLHTYGREAPVQFRTVWFRENILFNYHNEHQPPKQYTARSKDPATTLTAAVVEVLRALVDILEEVCTRLPPDTIVAQTVDTLVPKEAGRLTIFDKLEHTPAYQRERKKLLNVKTMRAAAVLSQMIRSYLRKMTFTFE